MTEERVEAEKTAQRVEPMASLSKRLLEFSQRAWRPAGTAVAVGLALLLMIHVVNGKNGLTIWNQKRAEDKQLQQEIEKLEQENGRLRAHVEQLRSSPDAIEHEAREKLHYAKPNEVIVALPPQTGDKAEPAAK